MMENKPQKQFMLLLNESEIGKFAAVFPGLKFVEVQAMNIKDSDSVQAIVTPMVKPAEEPVPEVISG